MGQVPTEPVRKERALRIVAAIVSFAIAFVMIAYGIAQRTVLGGPGSASISTVVDSDATVTVIDSKALHALDGRQKVDIGGAPTIFAAYARTADIEAWIGDASYNTVTANAAKTALKSKLVTGTDAQVPDPRGSDLWLGEYSQEDDLAFTVNLPEDISIIVVSDGVNPAPAELSLTWPVDNRTPWSGPLIAGGVVMLVVGIGLYLWALAGWRRMRGPRRKTPKGPKMPRVPRARIYGARQRAALPAARGRRSTRRMVAVLPFFLASTLVLSGCSPDLWPEVLGGTPETSPSPSSVASTKLAEAVPPPAVSIPQLTSIVASVSATAAKADADKDAALAATRFAGPALQLRQANYSIRAVDASVAPPDAIPAKPIELTLPQQSDSWPRTVFTVIQDVEQPTIPPTALMLIQETPRENYKVQYAVALEPNALLPDVAPADVGAARLPADIKGLLKLPPNQLAVAFGDIIANGDASTFMAQFEVAEDPLIIDPDKGIGLPSRDARKAKLPATASMSFEQASGENDIAFATNDSGAIVAVTLNEIVVVKPVSAGAQVNTEGAVKSLSKVTSTTKGTTATYADLLLFSVPAANSGGKIVLLGWATGLIDAKELP